MPPRLYTILIAIATLLATTPNGAAQLEPTAPIEDCGDQPVVDRADCTADTTLQTGVHTVDEGTETAEGVLTECEGPASGAQCVLGCPDGVVGQAVCLIEGPCAGPCWKAFVEDAIDDAAESAEETARHVGEEANRTIQTVLNAVECVDHGGCLGPVVPGIEQATDAASEAADALRELACELSPKEWEPSCPPV